MLVDGNIVTPINNSCSFFVNKLEDEMVTFTSKKGKLSQEFMIY